MVMAFTNGVMVENMKVSGKIITCMVLVDSSGPTADNMTANIVMIKWKAMEFTHGPMASSMRANGSTVNITVKAFIVKAVQRTGAASGKMAKE